MLSEQILPVQDFIQNGIYTRLTKIKAGLLLLGVIHKKAGVGFMMQGSMLIKTDGGKAIKVDSPLVIQTKAGSQRAVYALTDVVYCTTHSVDATTVEEAEKELFVEEPQITRIRNSYNSVIHRAGLTDDIINEIMPMCIKEDSDKFYLGASSIHGTGTFANMAFSPGECIAMAVVDGTRLTTARYVNHSDIPNCRFLDYSNNSIALIATKYIQKDTELFVNYEERLCLQR